MRLLTLLLAACAPLPEGLRATPEGTGPLVRIDWEAEPLPDIPFPNDLATRPDPTSPTGLFLNLPEHADIEIERVTRQRLNRLTGFGIFAPLTVGLDGRLDIDEILRRHPDDLHVPGAYEDDAVYLIDVTKGSPTYLQPVPLDFASGRFPADATRLGTFLTNDPRADQPHLLWDTGDEDVNGNGLLDEGEDTDGDGLLDRPNVWPPGGDPRFEVLSFYDLQRDDLVLRPVVPLREETTYAVVLTEALVDEDGQPVRSPWTWVNHTRQTDALLPVLDALDALGRDVNDVAFAWTFTTGSVTRELWEVAEGLRGRGPFRDLEQRFPAGVVEGHDLHDRVDLADPFALPPEIILGPAQQIDLLPVESVGIMADAYSSFTQSIVGGAFVTSDLLYDRDDGGRNDSDEVWDTDRRTGFVDAAERKIAFTCAIPKASHDVQPPWPVVIHAHGYGSTRIEFIAFAHAQNRMGMAVCAFDAHAHGVPDLGEYDDAVDDVLALTGAEPFWWHLRQDRLRDLDNDGDPDPAGDMYPADPFHARDMIRQPVLDQVNLIRALKACGTGEMKRIRYTQMGPVELGAPVVSCDWDGDGAPDIGGPDVEILLEGVSQGGIMTSVSAAIQPEAAAAVVTVPGGGLADVAGRTDIRAVADGMVGRALSPLIVGDVTESGFRIRQAVVTVDREELLHVATLPEVPAGGRVIVRNLALGTEEEGLVPEDGRFRVPIGANALDFADKAELAGIPPEGADPEVTYTVPGNAGLGDRLEIEVLDRYGRQVALIDTFEEDAEIEQVTFEAGSPLVAAGWGLGLRRGSADLRRLVGVLALGIEGGDPISYARHWFDEPYADPTPVLIHLTLGDTTVPEAAGVALARTVGLVDYEQHDDRYGTSVDRWLVDRHVVHAMEEFGPFTDAGGSPILFDPDDLDDGTDGYDAPSDVPLRSELDLPSGGKAGLRFLYVDDNGSHAYFVPDESLPFDVHLFGAQQMAWYLATRGREISDDRCLSTRDCPFLRPFDP